MKLEVYKLTVEPTIEPILLRDAKTHLRISEDVYADDAYVAALIKAVRRVCESYCEMQIMAATYEAYLPNFPNSWDSNYGDLDNEIQIIKHPVNAISKIEYYDTANELQLLSTAQYDAFVEGKPATIKRETSYSWPSTYTRQKAIIITFTAGYTNPDDVPEDLKQGMMMLLGHLYENRQDVVSGISIAEVPQASKYLWNPYKLKLL